MRTMNNTVREGAKKNERGLGSCLMAEELSLKPMTELLGLALRVALTICISVSGAVSPSSTNFAPKNQCRLHAHMFNMRKIYHMLHTKSTILCQQMASELMLS